MLRLFVVVVVIAAAVLWRVGEAHKKSCINAGKVNCSVLLWSGNYPGVNGGAQVRTNLIQGIGSSASGVGGSVAGSLGGGASHVP